MTDKTEILPCRFCGRKPNFENDPTIIYKGTSIPCFCLHSFELQESFEGFIDNFIKNGAAHSIIKYWNIRNEKHNPFLEKK